MNLKCKVNGSHTMLSFSKDGLFILETDMMTEKSHFQYGREDGQYDKFTEAVSKSKFLKI